MRILMLTQFYAPTIGGEERHVQDLSIELVKCGHDVAVVTLWQQGLADLELDQGVRVYRVHSTTQRAYWLYSENGRRHAPPLPDPEALWALRNVIMHEQPDIVHAHNWLLHSFLPLKLWSKAGLIVTLHDYSLLCAKKRLMHRGMPCQGPGLTKCLECAMNHYGVTKGITTVIANWAMGVAERHAVDMFLPVSQAVAVGNGLVDSQLPFRVIPNFVSNDLNVPCGANNSRLEQLPNDGYLLFVGDLSNDKGVGVLLEAYVQLTDAPPLVLIGRRCLDTPTTFPPNVIVLNNWPHPAVMEAWRRSRIALAPSVWPEPFGIVVIEAMATGRPVIASRIGGMLDILVDGETGLLVSPGDPLALRNAIERLLSDLVLQERIGQAAKRKAAEFCIDNIVPRIEQVYQEVFDAKREPRNAKRLSDDERGNCSA